MWIVMWSHFLDARFFGSVVLAVIMFWLILRQKSDYWSFKRQYPIYREAKFQTRSGEIVSLKSEEVDFRHREVSQNIKASIRLIKKIKRNKQGEWDRNR